MELPDRFDVLPTKCAKCGGERIERKELEMHSRWGFIGPGYRFDVYICGNCGYSEMFFHKASWL